GTHTHTHTHRYTQRQMEIICFMCVVGHIVTFNAIQCQVFRYFTVYVYTHKHTRAHTHTRAHPHHNTNHTHHTHTPTRPPLTHTRQLTIPLLTIQQPCGHSGNQPIHRSTSPSHFLMATAD